MAELTIITHLGLGDLILQSGLAVYMAEKYSKVYYPCRQKDLNSVRSFFLLQPRIEVVPIDTDSPHPDHRGIKAGSESLLLGFYSKTPMDKGISFAENFYRQAGVDYSVRWDLCPIQEVVDTFYGGNWYGPRFIFIHDDSERGFNIARAAICDPAYQVYPCNKSGSILSYAQLIRHSVEAHVIDGPFLHLAESLDLTKICPSPMPNYFWGESLVNDLAPLQEWWLDRIEKMDELFLKQLSPPEFVYCGLFYHRYARPPYARWNDIDCPTRKKWNILP